MRVGQIGLGTLTWGRDTEPEDARRMLAALLDAGGNLVDVSPAYAEGLAVPLLGELLDGEFSRQDVVIAAHAGVRYSPAGSMVNTGRGGLQDSLELILTDLRTTYVDVLHVAAPDPFSPLEETLETLAGFVQSGAVRYLGLANHPAWMTARAAQFMVDRQLPLISALSLDYSLLERGIEREVIPLATEMGLGVFAQSPLAAGVLTGKYRRSIPPTSRAATDHLGPMVARHLEADSRRIVEAVARAADGLGRTPSDVALAWVMDQPCVASVLCGARTGAQFEQLVSLDLSPLPDAVVSVLSEVTGAQFGYPER